jgi:heat-inducible transcriptional repressor
MQTEKREGRSSRVDEKSEGRKPGPLSGKRMLFVAPDDYPAYRVDLTELFSRHLVERGLAIWAGAESGLPARLIVRGRANLLENVNAQADLERLKLLFEDLETKEGLIRLLELAEEGSGVRIFIGSENKLFSLSGSSLVVAPYRDKDARVIGALGVIGPTRLNYARIVPMVDYTAQLIGRLLK